MFLGFVTFWHFAPRLEVTYSIGRVSAGRLEILHFPKKVELLNAALLPIQVPSCQRRRNRQCIVVVFDGYSMTTRLSLDIIKDAIFPDTENLR
jgi:hypothetical protein